MRSRVTLASLSAPPSSTRTSPGCELRTRGVRAFRIHPRDASELIVGWFYRVLGAEGAWEFSGLDGSGLAILHPPGKTKASIAVSPFRVLDTWPEHDQPSPPAKGGAWQ
jgi:hypothetical protein